MEYFKNKPETVAKIEKGLLAGTVYMVGPVLAELLHGVKTEKESKKLTGCIDAVPFIESNLQDWRLAGTISFKLRKKGITIPLTDLLIAAISINNNAFVYTLDQHFTLIPDVRIISGHNKNY